MLSPRRRYRQNKGEDNMTDKQHMIRRWRAAQAKADAYTVGDWKAAVRRGLASQWLACQAAAQAKAERLYARI